VFQSGRLIGHGVFYGPPRPGGRGLPQRSTFRPRSVTQRSLSTTTRELSICARPFCLPRKEIGRPLVAGEHGPPPGFGGAAAAADPLQQMQTLVALDGDTPAIGEETLRGVPNDSLWGEPSTLGAYAELLSWQWPR